MPISQIILSVQYVTYPKILYCYSLSKHNFWILCDVSLKLGFLINYSVLLKLMPKLSLLLIIVW